MICPHCHQDMIPNKEGRPLDRKASKAAGKPVHYQRYGCTRCFGYIKGEILPDVPTPV